MVLIRQETMEFCIAAMKAYCDQLATEPYPGLIEDAIREAFHKEYEAK